MAELPLVVVDVQRGGPSTGLPTKTEQSDLMQALYGRNGECPVVVLAASTPGDCFRFAFEAGKIAMEHMTPVIRHVRGWAFPGKAGLEHRIGGLEKHCLKGCISYEPANHQEMVRTRAAKVAAVADDLPRQEVMGAAEGDLLVIGWGGTRGNVQSAVEQLQEEGKRISLCHFNYIHPLPHGVREILGGFRRIVVCELNEGQLASYLRQQFQEFRFGQYNKCEGLPFTVVELKEEFNRILNEK